MDNDDSGICYYGGWMGVTLAQPALGLRSTGLYHTHTDMELLCRRTDERHYRLRAVKQEIFIRSCRRPQRVDLSGILCRRIVADVYSVQDKQMGDIWYSMCNPRHWMHRVCPHFYK